VPEASFLATGFSRWGKLPSGPKGQLFRTLYRHGWKPCPFKQRVRRVWKKYVSSPVVLRVKRRPSSRQWDEKRSAPAETEVPVSAVRGVEQSHNQSAWEVGTCGAAMFSVSRASIFRPCLRPAHRRVWADAIFGKPAARRNLFWCRNFVNDSSLSWCPGIRPSFRWKDCQLPRLHRASARPLEREEERSRRLALAKAAAARNSGQRVRSEVARISLSRRERYGQRRRAW